MYNLIGEKMRLRNVKGAKEEIEKSKYIIENYEQYKGKFINIFDNKNEIYIEIGMGKGDFIKNMALKYPNINFIGIEKFDSVMVRAIQKLEETEIPNLKLIKMDALNIDKIFDKEITCLYLNFSDPWPKARHEKRRLTSDIFLEKYDKILKTKKIIMKTDNRKLFEYSIKSLTDYGYKIDEISLDLHNDDIKDNVETEYEKKFTSLGNTIYRISVHK